MICRYGKRLVVLQVLVELRLDVLDQPGFDQQGVDLAVGGEEVDVGDLADQVGRAAVVGGGLEKVAAGPGAQVLGLADVDDPARRRPSSGRRRAVRELADLGQGG